MGKIIKDKFHALQSENLPLRVGKKRQVMLKIHFHAEKNSKCVNDFPCIYRRLRLQLSVTCAKGVSFTELEMRLCLHLALIYSYAVSTKKKS